MSSVLLLLCCALGCPLIVGAMVLLMSHDREGKRWEREIRRLNTEAERRRQAAALPPASVPEFDSVAGVGLRDAERQPSPGAREVALGQEGSACAGSPG